MYDAEAWRTRASPLSDFLDSLNINHEWPWSHANFEGTVHKIICHFETSNVCELGGGRTPLLNCEFADAMALHYVVNDISASELARAPDWVEKSCFDLSSSEVPNALRGQFDFIFSHMLMEHVTDARSAYRNVYAMLKRGGIFFHFHPVLYHPALVFNWLVPESISKRILLALQPDRHDEGYPKFPARYSYCTISEKTETMIQEVGFREVVLVPFYGTGYLDQVPPLQWLEEKLSGYARRNQKYFLASKSYTFGRK